MIPKSALDYAISKLGCKYSTDNRMSENTFDCSSLIYRAYKDAGYTFNTLYNTSMFLVYDENFDLLWPKNRILIGEGETSIASLKKQGYTPQPGDVIYIHTALGDNRYNKIGHVAIVETPDTIIHARNATFGVVRTSINIYDNKIVAVTRYKGGSAVELRKPRFAVIKENTVNMRQKRSGDSPIVYTVMKNMPMLALEDHEKWCKVLVLSETGFAYEGYMSKTFINFK